MRSPRASDKNSPALHMVRGTRELRRLLREAVDLRTLDVEGFRHWLAQRLPYWELDPAFVQRASIRELRRAHPELLVLEDTYRRATAADEASPQAARLREVEEELARTAKAIAGLGAALERSTPEKQPDLREKLAAFQTRQQTLRREQEALTQASPERREWLRVREELERLRSRLGLERAEADLSELLLQQGRRSGHVGGGFEQQALSLTWSTLVPDLVGKAGDTARLQVLTGVGLGAARTELDQLLIRRPRTSGQPVEVLALVEVKRNINDLAHGFRRRQENLAWFTGETGRYDPQAYRTRYFRSGHFDREAVHEQEGERFVFTRDSFRHFRREPGLGVFLHRLYFITRAGTLDGLSASALSRLRHRVATDEGGRLQSDAALRELLRWCQSLAEPLEAPDVLRLYCSVPGRGRQVLVVSR